MLRIASTSFLVVAVLCFPAQASLVTLRSDVDLNNLAGVTSFTMFVDLRLDAGDSLSELFAQVNFDAANFQAATPVPGPDIPDEFFGFSGVSFASGSFDGLSPFGGGPIVGPFNGVFFSFDVTVNRQDGAPDTGFFSFDDFRTNGVTYGGPLEYSFENSGTVPEPLSGAIWLGLGLVGFGLRSRAKREAA